MGEARKKSRRHVDILRAETRCIYCAAPPAQIEHMPPRAMFKTKSRPNGMVFATCAECNNGTSAADLVASFVSRLRPDDVVDDWEIKEAGALRPMLERKAPGFLKEFFRPDKNTTTWRRTSVGLLKPRVKVSADGPLVKGYLRVFASKLGMALYREHIGTPLAIEGAVYTQWFLNAGLAQATADAMLSILPAWGALRQGSFEVDNQFGYRFNSDDKSIVAALAKFHSGLYIFTIATSHPERYPLPVRGENTAILRPGELFDHMPPKGELFWPKSNE